VQAAPVQAAPVQSVPVQAAPVQAAPVQSAPVQSVPVQAAPVQAVPVVSAASFQNKYEKFTVPQSPTIILTIISNIDIPIIRFINLPIFNNFTISSTQTQATNISYLNNILKFKPASPIQKNTITTITINISLITAPSANPTSLGGSTTNGYITLS
jgi:hypothetical protein